MNNIPISIIYQGMLLTGHANPLETLDIVPFSLMVYIEGWYIGKLSYRNNKWSMDQPIDPVFIESLGDYIISHMQSLRKAMNYK